MIKTSLIIIIFGLFFNTPIFCETTAAALDIAGNAYEKNVGYGGVALFNNMGGLSCNPSIIPNMESINGTLSYINYLSDFKMFYGNFLYPGIGDFNVLGKFGYFYMPSVSDIETGEDLAYHEFFIGAGTGYHFLNKKLSVGATANFYSAKIATETGSTIYFDLGASYPFILSVPGYHEIIIGLSLLNLGPGVKFIDTASPLPFNFNLGFQYIYEYHYKLFAGLRKYTGYDSLLYSLGSEIALADIIFLRASIIEDINKNIKYNIGLGFDLDYTGYHFLLDYVFLPLEGTIEPSSVITLSFKFPIPGKKEIKKEEKNWKNSWTIE